MTKKALSIRLSNQMFEEVEKYSNLLGFTKPEFLRLVIFKYLDVEEQFEDIDTFIFPKMKNKKINLPVSLWTYNIVVNKAEVNNISINDLLVYGIQKAIDHFEKRNIFLDFDKQ